VIAVGRATRPLLALGLALGPATVADAAPEPLPYTLAVKVEWGTPRGPESFRADLERRLVVDLEAQRCFASVVSDPAENPGPDDLQLFLLVDRFEEETEYDTGVAERYDPEIDASRMLTVRLSADFHAELQTAAEGRLVRRREFHQSASWRPVYREDPRDRARDRLIDTVKRTTRKLLCKGSPEAWAKQIEKARSAPER